MVEENLGKLGKALEDYRPDVVRIGGRDPDLPLGMKDEQLIERVAARPDAVLLTRDRRMSTRPGEAALIRAHGLRVIRVGGRKDRGEWEKLTLVARSWGKLERERGRLGDGPLDRPPQLGREHRTRWAPMTP